MMKLFIYIRNSLRVIIYKISRPILIDVLVKILRERDETNRVRSEIIKIISNEVRIWGNKDRLKISPTSRMVNTLFNTSSGFIVIGDYTFTGHNVSIITGTHQYGSFLEKRMKDIPSFGNDIVIGNGVWIGSNAVILGPCKIGDHAVVAAGSVVIKDVPPCTIVAGVPARVVKTIECPEDNLEESAVD